MVEYIGLAEKITNGYSVFFPDFPGCGSAGRDLKEAKEKAREGLVSHIELMRKNREAIPQPLVFDRVVALTEAKNCIPLVISLSCHS